MMAAALAGDDTALINLVRLHSKQLFRFGMRVCGNEYDAEDAVQEALIVLARRPELRAQPNVVSWMYKVVKNWCLRLLRRSKGYMQRENTVLDANAQQSPTPESVLAEYQMAELVRQALAGLDQAYREIIVLRDLEGLSGERVCAALGLSEAAMKSRLHRARAALRKALAESVIRGGGDSVHE